MKYFRCFYRKQELLNTIKKSALANLLGFSALGPLVRSWFINMNEMDTPTHTPRTDTRRSFTPLHTGSCSKTSDSKYAARFYKKEVSGRVIQMCWTISSGVSLRTMRTPAQDWQQRQSCKSKSPTLSLQNGRTPGIDSLSIEFNKSF